MRITSTEDNNYWVEISLDEKNGARVLLLVDDAVDGSRTNCEVQHENLLMRTQVVDSTKSENDEESSNSSSSFSSSSSSSDDDDDDGNSASSSAGCVIEEIFKDEDETSITSEDAIIEERQQHLPNNNGRQNQDIENGFLLVNDHRYFNKTDSWRNGIIGNNKKKRRRLIFAVQFFCLCCLIIIAIILGIVLIGQQEEEEEYDTASTPYTPTTYIPTTEVESPPTTTSPSISPSSLSSPTPTTPPIPEEIIFFANADTYIANDIFSDNLIVRRNLNENKHYIKGSHTNNKQHQHHTTTILPSTTSDINDSQYIKNNMIRSLVSSLEEKDNNNNDDPCDVVPTTSKSNTIDIDDESDETVDDDDALRDPIFELSNIDKIIRIKVWSGRRNDYLLDNNNNTDVVIIQMEVTYRLITGEEISLLRGGDNNDHQDQDTQDGGGTLLLVGTVFIDDGNLFLTKIEYTKTRQYIDHISFVLSNGQRYGPWGGKTDQPPAEPTLFKSRSVIKAIYGKCGFALESLGCYYETNKVYKAELLQPQYSERYTIRIQDKSFDYADDPEAMTILSNFGNTETTTTIQSIQMNFEKTITSFETTTVTGSNDYSFEISVPPVSATTFDVIQAGTSFTFGNSFFVSKNNNETSNSNIVEFSETITRNYTVVAYPNTRVTAEIFYKEIQYMYDWQSPLMCFFQYNPSQRVQSNRLFMGSMGGSQIVSNGYVKLTEETPESIAKDRGSSESLLIQNGFDNDDGNNGITASYALISFNITRMPKSQGSVDRQKTAYLRLTHIPSRDEGEEYDEESLVDITISRLPRTSLIIEELYYSDYYVSDDIVDGPTFPVSPTNTTLDIDITELLFGKKSSSEPSAAFQDPTDQLLLMLSKKESSDSRGVWFKSRESSEGQPKLIISLKKEDER